MPDNCVFCKIANQDAPAHIVFEDDISIGFLDTRPLFPGHVLLIPKRHFGTLPDVEAQIVPLLFANIQQMSKAVPLAMGSEGSFVAMNNKVSQSVPHLHVHIVPRNKKDGLKGFFWPRNAYRDEEHAKETCERIKLTIAEITRAEAVRE